VGQLFDAKPTGSEGSDTSASQNKLEAIFFELLFLVAFPMLTHHLLVNRIDGQ
jgi:hypothetical protein